MEAKRQSFEDLNMAKPITILIKNGGIFTQTTVDFVEMNALNRDLQSKIDALTVRINSGGLGFTVLQKLYIFSLKLNQLSSFFYTQIIKPRPNKDLSKIVLLVKTKYTTILTNVLESLEELLEAELINEGTYLEQVNDVKAMFDEQIFDAIEALNSSSEIIISNNDIKVHFEEDRICVELVGRQSD